MLGLNPSRLCPNCGHHSGLRPDPSADGYARGGDGNPAVCGTCNHRFPGWERRKGMRAPCKWCGQKVRVADMESHLSSCSRKQRFVRAEQEATLRGARRSRPRRPMRWEGAEKRCEYCGATVAFVDYRAHVEAEHGDAISKGSGPFICPYCGDRFRGNRARSATLLFRNHVMETVDDDHGGPGKLPDSWPQIVEKAGTFAAYERGRYHG